jgi:hypothetical protein
MGYSISMNKSIEGLAKIAFSIVIDPLPVFFNIQSSLRLLAKFSNIGIAAKGAFNKSL